jgi:hypothetical protein
MNDTATQQGAARNEPPVPDPDVNPAKEVEVRMTPRQAQMEALAERQEQARVDELNEAMAADPGLAAEQARINGAIVEANAEAGITHEETQIEAGLQSQKTIAEQPPASPDLPGNLQDDPLADFIEMHNGAPMVKAKVNGQDRLIPLNDAKRQLQIGVASEVRMQSAAQKEKDVEARERRVIAQEAALSARIKTQSEVPVAPDLSEDELLEEAQDIFNTAFSGTEEDAAKKLAKTLAKIKAAATPAAQPMDQNAVARQAASMAAGYLTNQAKKKDVATGFAKFKSDYPDIVGDSNLFRMADEATETIEREHPDWTIAQVMDEAGKRTRDWVKNLAGQNPDTGDEPPPTPADQNSPSVAQSTQTRQDRKAGLVRMPTSAAAAVHTTPEPENNAEQSPQEALRELRASRGQPV